MSIPANIVEGRAQQTDPEFARFVKYAIASAAELEYHILVARDTSVIEPHTADALTEQTIEVRKMLHGLLKSISS
jgi:four helix bundle protein